MDISGYPLHVLKDNFLFSRFVLQLDIQSLPPNGELSQKAQVITGLGALKDVHMNITRLPGNRTAVMLMSECNLKCCNNSSENSN